MQFDHDLHKEGNGGVKGIDRMIIAEELPGILNMALAERDRVVAQGGFDVPRSCTIATENWIKESNMTALFLDERVRRTESRADVVLLSDMYVDYEQWCQRSGIKKPAGKQFFRQGIAGLGVEYDEKLPKGKRGFRCVVMKGFEEFD